jgi:hypothetical protein
VTRPGSDPVVPDDANEADLAEQHLSTTDDEDLVAPADAAEVDPADAAEQARTVTGDDGEYPHDLESSIEEA